MSGDEEMDSDWYILTLSQDDSIRENVTTQNSTRLFFYLNYNINYLVNITVIDCFGRKYSTLLHISESKCMHDNVLINYIFLFSSGGCDVPLSLVNASINEYESTHEGTDIMFTCNHGYYAIDGNNMTSQCINTSWTPNPQTFVCIPIPDGNILSSKHISIFTLYHSFIVDLVDCGVPMDNGNTTINFTSTTLGSIATYQCRDNVQTVHCTEDGIWLPQLNITCSTIGKWPLLCVPKV